MKLRYLMLALLVAPLLSYAAPKTTPVEIHLDHAPDRSHDQKALQNGARLFTKYCLTCHSASFMRFNRLRDIGFSEQQIKEELMFGKGKIGDPMTVMLSRDDALRWFSVVPPDHSITVRARTSELGPGEDWIYTYLRSFYRDLTRPSGWNNVVFPNVAMHNVLWEYQGEQVLGEDHKLRLLMPGKLTPEQYDDMVADLVGYLRYMSEPSEAKRQQLAPYVLGGLGLLLVFAIVLKPAAKKRRARRVAQAST